MHASIILATKCTAGLYVFLFPTFVFSRSYVV
jgi:hypothetical protein